MNLYFNGCSHTFGDDLVNRTQAWPSLVANTRKYKFVNDAMSGGTNDRIMYRTMKYAHEFDAVCIAWTYTSRFTRYRADNNHDVNFNPGLKHSMYGNFSEFKNYGRMHYQFWHNELYNFKIWLQNIILMQRYLNSINTPYVMINANHNYIDRWSCDRNLFKNSVKSLLCFDLITDEQLDAEQTEIQLLIDQIDTKHYLGWNSWWITQLHQLYALGPTGHLLETGHKAIADYILSHDSI
jgi:hypothetical protein